MARRLKAMFHDGAFIPQTPFDLPDDSEVEHMVRIIGTRVAG